MVYNFNININRNKRTKVDKKTGEVTTIKVNSAIQKKKIDYILSIIHINQYVDRSIKDGWVPINMDTLISVIGKDATSIMRHLIKENYITTDNIYKLGRSRKYKINYDLVPKKGIKSYDNPYYNKLCKLLSNIKKGDKITNYIIEQTNLMFHSGVVKFDDEDKVRSVVSKFRDESWDKYYSQTILIDKITSGDLTINVDSHGNRIYANYSNLSKDVRNHLQIDGEYTSYIDIKNSQFQFLALEINKKYPNIIKNDDVKLFYELVHTGGLYKYFDKELGTCNVPLPKPKKEEKYYKWKTLALNWLYAENYQCRSSKKIYGIEFIFKNRFPTIYNIINKIKDSKKGKGGSLLSIKMQSMESSIIKSIQYNLLLRGINCISIHDSIYVSRSNKYILKEVIDDLLSYGFMEVGIHIEDSKIEVKEKKYNNNNFIGIRERLIQSYSGHSNLEKTNIYTQKDKNESNLIKNEKKYDDKLKNYDSYILEMRKLLQN